MLVLQQDTERPQFVERGPQRDQPTAGVLHHGPGLARLAQD